MQFSTILLAFVAVLLVVSAGLMSFTMYKLAYAAADDKVVDFWSGNKLTLMAPTVMNVVGMALLGVLFVFG